MPTLIRMTKVKSERRDNASRPEVLSDHQYIPRIMGLIEVFVQSTNQGLTSFTTADGINTLITGIKVGQGLRTS
jgi:hypothetical protein